MTNNICYKLICIDEQHAIIAEQQLNNTETDKLKAKRLGHAVIVSISKEGLDQNELSEINYLLSSVRVHAMAYDDELSQYDREEIAKV
jgi:RNA-binding protein YhbY